MADRAVNELVAFQWSQARKLRGHDQRFEMGIVCGLYVRLSARETGLDTGLNCCCVHNAAVYGKVRPRVSRCATDGNPVPGRAMMRA